MDIRVIPTEIDGLVVVEQEPFRDERGFFVENYHKRLWAERGITADFVQDNHSRSSRNVLRGLHYQDTRAPMGKLVRCTVGAIFDVAVDLRLGSPTFGRWYGIELSADSFRQLFIPVGFAQSFVTLSDVAEVQYKCTGYYAPEAEGAIRWDDPDIAIAWPVRDPILSAKDRAAPSLADYLRAPAFRLDEPAAVEA
jgi:dTDP-4-dehydrorhamnose 3,5-epimerase